MAGHNKWSKIKRQKSVTDAKRSRIFQVLIRNIMTAAKHGGANIDTNASLRLAVTKAKLASLPADNIKKAIDKATGNVVGVKYEELLYEARASDNLALLIFVLTDNKNRIVALLRNVLNKANGSLCANGSVSWSFNTKGLFTFERSSEDEALLEFVLQYCDLVEDIIEHEDYIQLRCLESSYEALLKIIETDGRFELYEHSIEKIANEPLLLNEVQSIKAYDLIEKLNDIEEVSAVYSNLQYKLI